MTLRTTEIEELLVGQAAWLPGGRARSGIYKAPVDDALWLSATGLQGDEQADLRHHGGPEKAVHHYASEHYAGWAESLPGVADLRRPGAFGENVATTGWDETAVCIGDVIRMGGAVVQVSQGRQPCWKLDARLGRPGVARAMQASGRTGWYYRTLEQGLVRRGDTLALLERPHPDWPLSRLIALLFDRDANNAPAWAEAAELPTLATRWRVTFTRRLQSRVVEDWEPRLRMPSTDA